MPHEYEYRPREHLDIDNVLVSNTDDLIEALEGYDKSLFVEYC